MNWLNSFIGTNSVGQKDGSGNLERLIEVTVDWPPGMSGWWSGVEQTLPVCGAEEREMLAFPRAQPWPRAGGEQWAGDAHP